MRRIITVVVVALVMGAMMLAMAMPVLAYEPKETNSQGNGVGKTESSFTANGTGGPGSISQAAKDCGSCWGEGVSNVAQEPH